MKKQTPEKWEMTSMYQTIYADNTVKEVRDGKNWHNNNMWKYKMIALTFMAAFLENPKLCNTVIISSFGWKLELASAPLVSMFICVCNEKIHTIRLHQISVTPLLAKARWTELINFDKDWYQCSMESVSCPTTIKVWNILFGSWTLIILLITRFFFSNFCNKTSSHGHAKWNFTFQSHAVPVI